jgi:hypothetical protein
MPFKLYILLSCDSFKKKMTVCRVTDIRSIADRDENLLISDSIKADSLRPDEELIFITTLIHDTTEEEQRRIIGWNRAAKVIVFLGWNRSTNICWLAGIKEYNPNTSYHEEWCAAIKKQFQSMGGWKKLNPDLSVSERTAMKMKEVMEKENICMAIDIIPFDEFRMPEWTEELVNPKKRKVTMSEICPVK